MEISRFLKLACYFLPMITLNLHPNISVKWKIRFEKMNLALKKKTKRSDSAAFSVRIMKGPMPTTHLSQYNRGHWSTESSPSYFPVAQPWKASNLAKPIRQLKFIKSLRRTEDRCTLTNMSRNMKVTWGYQDFIVMHNVSWVILSRLFQNQQIYKTRQRISWGSPRQTERDVGVQEWR